MMIEKNLGNIERVIRLLAGVVFAFWSLAQVHLNAIDWFVAGVSLMLILNGIFSRCYLWYILDVDTRSRNHRQKTTSGLHECG
ncbi:MAG: DUF2892 domain-containing protein [Halioglobus sp.]|nr:DUF2892 domain-containing protein [Halioglobus sp.]